MWSCPGGEPQIQDYLSLFLTAVNEGKLSLDTLVRISSYNAAKLFNVYPKKGVIQPGSDADMVIVDMNKEEVISNETTYTKVGWTPYHGRKSQRRADPHDRARQDRHARWQNYSASREMASW